MTFPYAPNCKLDVYRGFNVNNPLGAVQGNPILKDVQGFLRPYVRNGRFGYRQSIYYTTLVYVNLGTDIRDGFNSNLNTINAAQADTIVVKDYPIDGKNTAFLPVLCQRAGRINPLSFIKVYLDKAGNPEQPICCPNVPNRLYVQISDTFGNCLCMDGAYFAIDFTPSTTRWEGTFNACGQTARFVLACDNPQYGVFGFNWYLECPVGNGLTGPLSSHTFNSTCQPFFLEFNEAIGTSFPLCSCLIDSFFFVRIHV